MKNSWVAALVIGIQLVLVSVAGASSSPSLEEKIGQMLMVGFRGTVVDKDHFVVRAISEKNLGGVILFDYDLDTRRSGRNIASPEQLKDLVAALQQASASPLLVAVDQEGGQVARLKAHDGFVPTVSHRSLGKLDDLEATTRLSLELAQTLAESGVSLNLAPVVDLCANPDNPIIARYERCFSADADQVIAHARAFIAAHLQAGVLTALKHFPGHGSSAADSHLGFTDITQSWSEVELAPFRRLIAEGQVDTVMTAHVFNARLDDQHPATLSSAVISGLLRKELDFDGVIISDDMQMGAITRHYSLADAIRLAIEAGVDILVFGNNLAYDEQIVERAIRIISELIDGGILCESRIQASYDRIQNLKKRITR
ncbi:glycoside hydrolase family 3 N-terminal domain-containing protein [Geoalkalibacter halelectricus]|uniref:glycoside hydrolase family 3 N-terminal domain-containing protein n=1 Tax=Geoalkalibacter halelectricus TaxID=2847045 RepID=UPI003D1C3658